MSEVPIDQIKPSPYQPRLYFDLETIKESIKQDGMLVVPLVRRKPDNKNEFELIDGERRWRAAKELGWKTIQVQIRDVNDETARRMVYTLNEERQPYTLEENTKFLRRMYEQMGSANAVAQAFNKSNSTVWRYINISMLPEHLQKVVWSGSGKVTVGMIAELEPIFAEARDEIGGISYVGNSKSPAYQKIIAWLERAYTGQVKDREELRKQYVDPYLETLDKKRIETAKEEVAKIIPQDLIESKEVKLETPEELERTAKVLRREAKRKRAETVTPEEKARRETEKKRKAEEKRKRKEESKKQEEEKLQKKLEVEKRRLEDETKRKLEVEKKRLEGESKAKAKEELLKDKDFIREFREKDHPLPVEDLKKQLMQKLSADVPEEKRERAEQIFEEGFDSLQKRIEIFPEKSQKIEPKFDQLRSLEERGVTPYTVWDFPYRDDYAGERDFHGNCSPQVVEQCVWRLTEEGDLVVDPMAGSGTALDVCKKYNRRSIGYDIKPPEDRPDIAQNDSSRKIPLEDRSADMVFIHPPYWNLVHYTKAEENLPDLSRAKTSDEFIDMLERVFRECYRILKTNKFMCVLLGDLIRDGRFVPLCRKATDMAEKLGFIDYGYAVKLAHGEVSRKKSGVIVAEPIYTNNLKISHDLVMFFRRG